DGRNLLDIPARERNFGIVFQSYSLFPNMSVARNIAYGLECRKWPRQEIPARVAEMLALVNLADQADKPPHQLSGGQQQRVALAGIRPEHIELVDEATTSLEHRSGRVLRCVFLGSITRVTISVDGEPVTIELTGRRDDLTPDTAVAIRIPAGAVLRLDDAAG